MATHPHIIYIITHDIERFPEQYPATVDSFAEPVASDDRDMKAVRSLLKNTNLEFRALKLTYSANRDGWNAPSFHRKVDKLGGGLVVCTTEDGLVCGGVRIVADCDVSCFVDRKSYLRTLLSSTIQKDGSDMEKLVGRLLHFCLYSSEDLESYRPNFRKLVGLR